MAASDEVVWQIINQGFCSFKVKPKKGQNFCRNEYNVTGLCNRQSCPLANSRYATVRAGPKGIYLYIKVAERAHLPSKLWEKIRLSGNYTKALAEIDSRLQFFPKFLQHKAKQRLTRLTQVEIRTRRIAAEEARLGERLVPKLAPKVRQRERARERKAEVAARLERTAERQLLERLRQGAYGTDAQPLNVSEEIWKKVLRQLERDGDAVRDQDMDKGLAADGDEEEEELEEEEEYEREEAVEDDLNGAVEYVSDIEESDDDLDDIEDWLGSEDEDDEDDEDDEESEEEETEKEKQKQAAKAGDKRKRGRVIRMKQKKLREVEEEREDQRQKLLAF